MVDQIENTTGRLNCRSFAFRMNSNSAILVSDEYVFRIHKQNPLSLKYIWLLVSHHIVGAG